MSNVEPPNAKKYINELKQVQWRATEMIFGAAAIALWGEAAGTGLVQAGQQSVLGRPNKQQPQVPMEGLLRRWSQTLHSGGRTTENRPKLKEGRLYLDVKKNFFPARTIRQWSWLSGEAVQAPSLQALKNQVDKALSSLFWPPGWPSFRQGIDSIRGVLRSLIILWSYVIVQKYWVRFHSGGIV